MRSALLTYFFAVYNILARYLVHELRGGVVVERERVVTVFVCHVCGCDQGSLGLGNNWPTLVVISSTMVLEGNFHGNFRTISETFPGTFQETISET